MRTERLVCLRQPRDQLDREYGTPLLVSALAHQAGYSRAHFIRACREAYGETPARYRMRRRIAEASDLLRTTSLTVTAICFQTGLASLGSFSARFTAVMGLSPSAYRAAARHQGGPAPVPGCFTHMWRAGLPLSPPRKDSTFEGAKPGAVGYHDRECRGDAQTGGAEAD